MLSIGGNLCQNFDLSLVWQKYKKFLMFDYMFGSYVKLSWKKRGISTMIQRIKFERICLCREVPWKILWLHNKANNIDMKNNVDMKILGHAGYDV